MKKQNVYTVLGYVFVAASALAMTFDATSIFAAWLPIGAAFIAIGYSEKSKKN